MDAGDSNAVLIRRLILTNVGGVGSVGSQYDRWTGNIANVHFTGGIAEVEDIVGNQAGIGVGQDSDSEPSVLHRVIGEFDFDAGRIRCPTAWENGDRRRGGEVGEG